MIRADARGAVAMLAWALFGCGNAERERSSEEWAGTVDTLASGRVVVRNPDRPLWGDGEGWTLEELYRLGTLSGEGPELFGQVSAVELGDRGELYVLDAQASEIRVFDGDGRHVRTFGRPGQGPGELNRPVGIAVDSQGSLWVMNWGNARYTGFDPGTGEVHREVRRLATFVTMPWPGRFDEQDRLLDVGLDREMQPTILRLDTAFVPTDTMNLPQPTDEDRVGFTRDGVMVMSAMEPFAPQPAWAARPRGGIVLAEGEEYRLHRIGFEGDTTMTVTLLREPVRVTAEERDSALAVFAEMTQALEGATPERQPRVRETKPAHGPILVDDEDRVWLRVTTTGEDGPAWDVIEADGRFLGQVEIPVSPSWANPAVRGDRLAVVTEMDGVPTVVVYRIVGVDQ